LTILADPNAAGFYERNGAARGSTNSLFKFSVSGGISGRERDDAGADRRADSPACAGLFFPLGYRQNP
jgi:hypothetical protein